MTGRWATSTRRTQLPANWPALRRRRRAMAAGKCEAEQHADKCDGIGTELDHHRDRADHRLESLRWLSTPCHAAKTQREAAAARPSRLRPVEAPPGLRVGGGPPPARRGTGGDSSSARIQVPSLTPPQNVADEELEPAASPVVQRPDRHGAELLVDGLELGDVLADLAASYTDIDLDELRREAEARRPGGVGE